METRRNATAGVPFWTPAPVRASPTSTETSDDDVWEGEEEEGEEEEEEEEEQAESEDDFASQMDENGIIGLSEALEDVEMGGPLVDLPGSLKSRVCVQETSFSQTKPLRDDLPKPSSCDNIKAGFRSWTEDEDVRQRTKQQRTEQLDVTDEEEDIQTSDTYKHEQSCTSGEAGVAGTRGRIGLTRSCSVLLPQVEPAGVSKHKLSQSVPALSHLLHFTVEELASAPGIDAETFPEMSFLESLPDSHSSHKSLRSSSCLPRPKLKPGASPQPDKMLSEQVGSDWDSEESESPGKRSENFDKQYKPPHLTASPRTMRTCSHEDSFIKTLHTSRTESVKSKQHRGRSPNEPDQCRKGTLVPSTPDLSKVEAKVHFPKGGYKPPKSRLSKKNSVGPEAPLVFKSPADIVKEVLLNTADEAPAASGSVAVSTLPQDFRSRQQATSLLEQLQEDYNRLLTKYAAAENTIDRLRLEAKVNLYSDPPVAGHCVQSAVNHDALKFIQMDFPQSSRAEINSAAVPPNEHNTHQAGSSPSTSNPLQLGRQLATILFGQADKFLQQLQTFENLLKSGKLKPREQAVSLSHLAEGLDSLERGYLLTRDEHKLLQQRGAATSHFDPERELEGLVFQCGLHLEELKEQVEQKLQEELVCETPPSPPHQHTRPSSSGRRGTPTHPQSQLVASLDDLGEAAQGELSSISKESDEEEAQYKESLNSFCLKPLKREHRCAEPDFIVPFDPDQSFKELPKHLMHSLRERVAITAPSQRDFQEEGRRGSGTKEVQNSTSQRRVQSDHDSSPISTSKQRRGSPPESPILSQPTTPVHPGLHPRSRRRLEEGRSHSSSLSSMGDVAASERRSSKTQDGSRRVLAQDGIISPETDSGFIGSESSRVTPAAAQSPLQQRAAESVSVSLVGNSGRPHGSSPSQSHSGTAPGPTAAPRLALQQPGRSVKEPQRRTFSCSPQHWTQHTGVNNHTESEGDQSDRFTESVDSAHTFHLSSSSSSSSSPAAHRHHGDSLTAPSSTQRPHCNDVIQTLQAEVSRLKERLDGGLRSPKQHRSRHVLLTPRIRSAEQQSRVGEGRRPKMLDEVDESALRPTVKKRPARKHEALSRSELQSASVQSYTPQTSHVSRSTQTPAAPDARCSHPTGSRSRTTQQRQPSVMSALMCEAADESDSRSHGVAPRSHRVSHHRRSEHGGDREPSHSHCSHCEGLELQRRPEPDRCRHSHSAACQTSESPERATRSGHMSAAAPPALLHWQPACPPQLLLYSSPLYVPPPPDSLSGVRGRRTRRSPSVDRGTSVDDSLNKAIRAARHMKHTSRHMARSLEAGLQHQELLAQSCSH